jgi:hypothetical protein
MCVVFARAVLPTGTLGRWTETPLWFRFGLVFRELNLRVCLLASTLLAL